MPEVSPPAPTYRAHRDSARRPTLKRTRRPNATGYKRGTLTTPSRSPTTKTLWETHTGGCRVRRKRKRLTSNDSIETDAAVALSPRPKSVAPRHFR